ncbi:unnamed protein product [Staurois parvus]|uniref:Uncharacterized protein n=1 Tax=Staurois parvus TaxID=386267 RepID=A0ABN9B1G1_9NEOB|nr:unnamed protein product [Staurois parvus]
MQPLCILEPQTGSVDLDQEQISLLQSKA